MMAITIKELALNYSLYWRNIHKKVVTILRWAWLSEVVMKFRKIHNAPMYWYPWARVQQNNFLFASWGLNSIPINRIKFIWIPDFLNNFIFLSASAPALVSQDHWYRIIKSRLDILVQLVRIPSIFYLRETIYHFTVYKQFYKSFLVIFLYILLLSIRYYYGQQFYCVCWPLLISFKLFTNFFAFSLQC